MAKTPTRDPLGRLAPARPLVELAELLRSRKAATASGLWGSSVGAVTSVLQRALGRPVLVVCGHIDEADDLADDIELFLGRRPEGLPALELSGGLGGQSEEQVANRMQLVFRLAEKGGGKNLVAEGSKPLIVAPIQALMQPVPSKGQLKHLVREVSAGQSLEPEKLIVWL